MGTSLGHEDERPPHRVFIDSFELGVCAVARQEYERFMNATGHEAPCDWSEPPFERADLPVVGVSWLDAVASCEWRSGQDGRPVRLPTEAEWEFAARGSQRRSSRGATRRRRGFPTADAARYRHRGRSHSASRPISACSVSRPTCTSGALTGTTRTTTADRRSGIPLVPTKVCDVPLAAERGATRRPSAASRCAASSIRPSATTTSGSVSREASEPAPVDGRRRGRQPPP